MNLFTISLRNLERRPCRAFLFSAVFIAGLTAVVALHYVSKDIGHSMEEKLSRFGANVVIIPKELNHTVSYGGVPLGSLSYIVTYLDEAETVSAVRNIKFNKNISAVAPKLIETAAVGDKPLLLVGVDWEQEIYLNPAWGLHYDDVAQPVYTVAGYTAAERLGINAGDALTLSGSIITVNKVLAKTGGDADNLVFTTLRNLQQISGKDNKINFVEVAALCSACPIDDIVKQISEGTTAEVKALQNVVKQRMYTIGFIEKLVLCIIIIILSASMLMMALFMLSSVNERKKEIGIMRSMGYPRQSIFAAICAEAAIIALLSGAAGYVLGAFASHKVLTIMDIASAGSFHLTDFILTVAIAVTIAVSAAAIPAFKASRLNPAEALSRL